MKIENSTRIKRIYSIIFSDIYLCYVAKANKKGRTKKEVDEIIFWLTGYNQKNLENQIKKQKTFQMFFSEAPKMNPLRFLIKGSVCGVKLKEIKDPLMLEIRYLDKLIDELAKGKKMEKILRTE